MRSQKVKDKKPDAFAGFPRISTAFISNSGSTMRLNTVRGVKLINKYGSTQSKPASEIYFPGLQCMLFNSKWLYFVVNNCLSSFTNVMILLKNASLK